MRKFDIIFLITSETVKKLLMRWKIMSATVMSFCNQGWCRKTTTALVSWLVKLGSKTVIDFGPANITRSFWAKTRGQSAVATINKSLMTVMQNEEPLTNAILSINENLDLIPTAVDFSLYGRFLENRSDEKAVLPTSASAKNSWLIVRFYLYRRSAYAGLPTIRLLCLRSDHHRSADAGTFTGWCRILRYLRRVIINSFNPRSTSSACASAVQARLFRWRQILQRQNLARQHFQQSHTIMERVKRMDMTGCWQRKMPGTARRKMRTKRSPKSSNDWIGQARKG